MGRKFMIQSFVDEDEKKIFYSEVDSNYSETCIIKTEILKRFIREGYGKYYIRKSEELVRVTPDSCDNALYGLKKY